jgi:hypothetical protein
VLDENSVPDPAAPAQVVEQWFMDDEFKTPLPPVLAAEILRFYGSGPVGVNFAQCLAAFLPHSAELR